MAEEVIKLLKLKLFIDYDEQTLCLLSQAACRRLDGMLLPNVKVEEIRDEYIMAAAWIVMSWLGQTEDSATITEITAGSMSVRRASGNNSMTCALELMAPYVRDRSFVFRGVRG